MSAQNDAAFLRVFLFILGALGAFTISIMFIASYVSEDLNQKRSQDSRLQAAIAERIKPIGEVKVAEAGEIQAAPETVEDTKPKVVQAEVTQAPVTPTSSVAPAASAGKGKEVYNTACLACHISGAAGAPILGDKAAWTDRLAQGTDALYANAINGKGAMPAKGGRLDLADADVKAAVDYMLEQLK